MQLLVGSFLLLAAAGAAITSGMKVQYWGTDAEREAIISEAVSEAKLSATLREQAAQASINSNKPLTASMKLARGFKKASPRVQRAGKARIFMEDAVKRAERKLFELKKATDAQSMSAEARAEEIATELFHRPGRFLKEDELATIFAESECIDERHADDINCFTPPKLEFRTIDGTCNNLENITFGASETSFRRLIPGQYEDGISVLDGTVQFLSVPEEGGKLSQIMRVGPFEPPHPSPRLVSLQIIRDREINEVPITHILMQWGQFLDHDLDLGPELEEHCEGCDLTDVCHNIRVPDIDPIFGVGTARNGDCLPFRRSVASCVTPSPGSFEPREQINVLTSFIDGSMIYGSTVETLKVVRQFENGLLRTGPPLRSGQKDTLPNIRSLESQGVEGVRRAVACLTEEGDDCFVCGDVRCNEQTSLTVMHTLWVREHNRLARELQRINPHWSDEKLFQEARAIVGALVQKITYLDYLPVVLGETVYNQVIGPFRGYDPDVNPSVPNSFATAAYRYGHSLIQPEFARLNSNYKPISAGPLPLRDAFFNIDAFTESEGTDPILRGLVNVNSRRMDESLTSPLTSQLFEDPSIPGSGMDLASLNIQRSRDHGLPSYTTFKRFCQSVFPELTFTDIENQLTFVRLLQVYGSLESVELWVGGLAEERLPGSLLGPTFSCLFGLTFRNARDGDRFYFENENGHFLDSQLAEIRKTTLSSVLCSSGDDIGSVQSNAFLTGQPRLHCAQIPAINLGPWREHPCYARINPANTNGLVYSFSTLEDRRIFETFTNLDDANCLPFVCPTETVGSLLAILPSGFSLECVTEPNSGLPPNTGFNFYFDTIESASVVPANGLYSSLESCQHATTNAFTFHNCLQSLSAQGKTDDCSLEGPDCNASLPEDLEELLKENSDVYNYATSYGGEKNAAEEGENVQDNFVTQQQLLHELEIDLKQLNQQEIAG